MIVMLCVDHVTSYVRLQISYWTVVFNMHHITSHHTSLHQEKVDADVTLELLRERLDLLRLGLSPEQGLEGKKASQQLLAACVKDPYLRENEGTLFSDPAGSKHWAMSSMFEIPLLNCYLPPTR